MIESVKRPFFSTSNTVNIILIVAGLIGFAMIGGSAVALPGIIAFFGGVFGLIRNYKTNQRDLRMPWIVLIALILLALGLLSTVVLLLINPVEQLERARQVQ